MDQNLEEKLIPISYHVEIEGANYIVGTEGLRFDRQNHNPPHIKGRVYVNKTNKNRFLPFFKHQKRIFQSSLNISSVCKMEFGYFHTALIHLADRFPKEFEKKDIKYFEFLFSGVYGHYNSLR